MTHPVPTAPHPVLSIDSFSVERLGQTIVREVSLAVAPGSVTVLLGANGAGKSTLLDGISGVIPASGGRILLDGTELGKFSRRRRGVLGMAYVQQGRTVFPDLTVRENFLVAAPRTKAAFDLFPELRNRADVKARSLSGGEQQMVVLGRAMLARPRVLLIDELSLGLAPSVVDRMFDAVADMVADGIGVLLVEQFADRALAIGDHAAVLARGQVVLTGRAEELRNHPEQLAAAYLGNVESIPTGSMSREDATQNQSDELIRRVP